MSIINIHILMGLPGSGKTYFANNFEKKHDENTIVIHLDDFISNNRYDFENALPYGYRYLNNRSLPYEQHIILDGLFLTNKRIAEVLELMLDDIFSRFRCNCEVTIHHWNKDIDSCIHNDRYRRCGVNSRAVIKNADYEEANIEAVKKELDIDFNDLPIKVEEMTVNKYPLFERLKNEYGQILKSQDWNVGGRWGNCWGDSGSVSAETPLEFDEFDQLLENIAPSISFLQYKKLRNNCVKLIESTDYGYYGSYTDQNHWECDIKKLFEMLIDMNIIFEDE